MSPRRSKFQLTIEVLETVKKGETKPTRIMYGCNLSWKSLNSILTNLIEQGLMDVEEIPGRKRSKKHYSISTKGESVLKYYRKVNELIEVNPVKVKPY